MSSDSTPYAFNPLDGEEEDAIRHLRAIKRQYEKAHGQMSHGTGFQVPIESLVTTFRSFDGKPRPDGQIMPDFGYKYVNLTHHDNNLTISFSSTTPDEAKVQHVDPADYKEEHQSPTDLQLVVNA